ncbi:MAG TPA: sensor histidine kinase [Candidatus Binatia bacterium]|nr:sensor histidine kinase [Candidatus Binatia bacterium]
MESQPAESRYFQNQVAFARPVFLVLALVALADAPPFPALESCVAMLVVYLLAALVLAFFAASDRLPALRLPPLADVLLLAGYFCLTPPLTSTIFLYLFVCFASAIYWGLQQTLLLAGVTSLGFLLLRVEMSGQEILPGLITGSAVAVGTFAAGSGLGFLADRQRRHARETEFLSQLTAMLNVEQGLSESLRKLLEGLAVTFQCERASLAFLDAETERLFVWTARRQQPERISPESHPPQRADAFLLDCPDATVCWNSLEGRGEGFGWNRRDGRRLLEVPRLPGISRRELGIRAIAAVTFDFGTQPGGRLLLINPEHGLTPRALRWFERIAASLSAPLENLYLLRHLRARAIDAERSRISHDLHDGVLQTLLGSIIQLDVLRKRLPAGDPLAADVEHIEDALRRENAELRKMVLDLRPLRVGRADMLDLIRGFSDRFRQEAKIEVDCLLQELDLRVSDRACRELFSICREALNNVKKHAQATHVVIKLWQDEGSVHLVIDDNGQGFSFAGRFSSEELDRLRIGPISIKERTRSIGGSLTVESTPGHGARILVELPVN